jgi:hypothetical protein
MAKAKLLFTENDLRRAIRAAVKASLQMERVVVDRQGNIEIVVAQEATTPGKKTDQRAPSDRECAR